MNILVSFCNIDTAKIFDPKSNISPLLLLDTNSNQQKWIKIPLTNGFCGITGLTQNDKYIYAASQNNISTYIYTIDKKTLFTIKYQKLTKVKDAHSIMYENNRLHIVSTGNNTIYTYTIDKNNDLKYKKILYQYKNHTKDTIHINSIARYDDDYYFSAFGPKKDNLNTKTDSGYIINIKNKVNEIKPIYHPHSVTFRNSDIYYCESKKSIIYKNNKKIINLIPGYTRGLIVDDNYIICGTSTPRIKSRSTGKKMISIIDPNIKCCQIHIYKKFHFINYRIKTINFSKYFDEIYDVLKIS